MSSNLESKRPRKYKKKEKEKQDSIITTNKDQDDDKSNDCYEEEEEEENKGKLKKKKNERRKILYQLLHTHDACDNPVKFKSKTHEILKQILNKNHNIPYT